MTPLISSITCPICLVNQADYTIPNCEHTFCTSCLKSYLNTKIQEAEVLQITCPIGNCGILSKELIQSLVSSEVFTKYNEFYEKKSLEASIYFRWCPQPSCKGHSVYKNSNKLICNTCSYEFCFLCSEKWHKNKCRNGSSDFFKWKNAKQVKLCPNCKVKIQKNGGCPNMSCSKCFYKFCWRCEKSLHQHSHYKCLGINDWYNFPLLIIAVIIFSPLLFFFTLPIMVIALHNFNEYDAEENRNWLENILFRHPYLIALVLLPLSPPLMALVFVLGIIGASLVASDALVSFKNTTNIIWGFILFLLFLILAALIMCLLFAIIALGISIFITAGFVLLVIKIGYTFLRLIRIIKLN
ncbi:hypothetical protein SteCoe_31700 [Stentor coeruleus]|uniref:RBR-type E3 ubiquitin transferase n=1 Tax=Stentor coeruleus TaxID=5963 RepID=A0A1R2B0Q9_9CILI|nr:hypothetical protein SteCoe_31700 [Stentor coeruleus]